jgi:hypothetical protein
MWLPPQALLFAVDRLLFSLLSSLKRSLLHVFNIYFNYPLRARRTNVWELAHDFFN